MSAWIEIRFCSQVAGRYSASVARMYDTEVGKWLGERLAHSRGPVLITEVKVVKIELDKLMEEKQKEHSHH